MALPPSIRPENTDQLAGANADLNLCKEAAHILFSGIVCSFWRIRLWIAKSLFLNTIYMYFLRSFKYV